MVNDQLDGHRIGTALFVLSGVVAMIFLAFTLPRTRLGTASLELLPAQLRAALPEELGRAVAGELERELLFMVRAPLARAQAARLLAERLSQDSRLGSINGPLPRQRQLEIGTFLSANRVALADVTTRQRLASGPQEYAAYVMSMLFTALSGDGEGAHSPDPQLLMRALLESSGQTGLVVDDEFLALREGETLWYLLRAQLRSSCAAAADCMDLADRLQAYAEEVQAAYPDAEVRHWGEVFKGAAAAQHARRALVSWGLGSAGLVLLAVGVAFRTLSALLLCLGSLAAGLLYGLAALTLVFREIQPFTVLMAFGSSGIAASYTVYYLMRRGIDAGSADPFQSLRWVRPALLQVVLMTLLAYAGMLILPEAGIRQFVLFVLAGLSGCALFVLCIEPWLTAQVKPRALPCAAQHARYLRLWQNRAALRWAAPLLCAAMAAAGLAGLHPDDDLHSPQALPAGPGDGAEQSAGGMAQSAEPKFMLLYAQNVTELLQNQEQLAELLHEACQRGWLAAYRTLPLNSLPTQQLNYQLLFEAAQTMTEVFRQNGIEMDYIVLERRSLQLPEFLAAVGELGYAQLFLRTAAYSALLLPLEGVANPAALHDIARRCTDTYYVDRHHSYAELASGARWQLSCLGGAILAVLLIYLLLQLGLGQGLRSWLVSVIATALAAGVQGLCGQGLGVWSIWALLLVIALGSGYPAFLSRADEQIGRVGTANALAMVITLVSLAGLACSPLPALSAFGLVLCAGLLASFMLSPLVLARRTLQPALAAAEHLPAAPDHAAASASPAEPGDRPAPDRLPGDTGSERSDGTAGSAPASRQQADRSSAQPHNPVTSAALPQSHAAPPDEERETPGGGVPGPDSAERAAAAASLGSASPAAPPALAVPHDSRQGPAAMPGEAEAGAGLGSDAHRREPLSGEAAAVPAAGSAPDAAAGAAAGTQDADRAMAAVRGSGIYPDALAGTSRTGAIAPRGYTVRAISGHVASLAEAAAPPRHSADRGAADPAGKTVWPLPSSAGQLVRAEHAPEGWAGQSSETADRAAQPPAAAEHWAGRSAVREAGRESPAGHWAGGLDRTADSSSAAAQTGTAGLQNLKPQHQDRKERP